MSHPATLSGRDCGKCRVVGLTGGIGSGKSVVSRILRLNGFHVYDCDSHAKILMDSDPILCRDIAERLGADCLTEDGVLVRSAIAKKIFSDPEAREWLNVRVHKLVHDDFLENLRIFFDRDAIFVEAAVLRSSGLWRVCDVVWIIDAPVEIRLRRVEERNALPTEAVKARMESQKEEFDFSSLLPSDAVRYISNDGVTPLLPQLSAELSRLT